MLRHPKAVEPARKTYTREEIANEHRLRHQTHPSASAKGIHCELIGLGAR